MLVISKINCMRSQFDPTEVTLTSEHVEKSLVTAKQPKQTEFWSGKEHLAEVH